MNKLKMRFAIVAATLSIGVLLAPAVSAKPLSVVVLGDSLSAGYGLLPGEAFPEQLEAALKADGRDVTVANGGVSGDTAADGLARLEWSVPADAGLVIVELGANDALRGIDPQATKAALGEIVVRLKARGQAVLLAGMLAPRNLDDTYAKAFDAIYPARAAQYSVPLYPFFLEGVATDPALNQADGMHPTAEGVAKIVRAIKPKVETMLAALPAAG